LNIIGAKYGGLIIITDGDRVAKAMKKIDEDIEKDC
jgi:hypothetical protein